MLQIVFLSNYIHIMSYYVLLHQNSLKLLPLKFILKIEIALKLSQNTLKYQNISKLQNCLQNNIEIMKPLSFLITPSQMQQILLKYFEQSFNVYKLRLHFPNHGIMEIQSIISICITKTLKRIEQQLYSSKIIANPHFTDSINSRSIQELIKLDEILDENSREKLLKYYRSEILGLLLKEQGEYPPEQKEEKSIEKAAMTISQKLNVYRQFLHYSLKKNLVSSSLFQFYRIQQELSEICTIQQLTDICHTVRCSTQQIIGFPSQNVHKIGNLVLLGLYRVYIEYLGNFGMSSGLELKDFKKIYSNIYGKWEMEKIQILIRIAIYDDAKKKEIMMFCVLMVQSEVGKYGWKFKGLSHEKYVENQKHSKFVQSTESEQLLQIIKREMRNIYISQQSQKLHPKQQQN